MGLDVFLKGEVNNVIWPINKLFRFVFKEVPWCYVMFYKFLHDTTVSFYYRNVNGGPTKGLT